MILIKYTFFYKTNLRFWVIKKVIIFCVYGILIFALLVCVWVKFGAYGLQPRYDANAKCNI